MSSEWADEDRALSKRVADRLFDGLPMLRREAEESYLIAKGQVEAESSRIQPADGSFVAAKALRDLREMTATKCNKFLKSNGTESTEPVEGKVRFRKPNKKTLEIHAGDWISFWQEFDRRRSEALDEGALQEFLENVEADKVKIKSAAKRRRSSSGQVP